MPKEIKKLTDEVFEILVEAFSQGLSKVAACRKAGIHRNTLNLWLKQGASNKSGKYRKFYEAVEEARNTFWEAKQSEIEQVVYRRATEREKTLNIKFSRVMKLPAEDTLLIQEAIEANETLKERFEQEGILYKQEVTIKEHLPDAQVGLEILSRKSPEEWGRYETLKLEMDIRKELEELGIPPDAVDTVVLGAVETMEQLIENNGDVAETPDGESSAE